MAASEYDRLRMAMMFKTENPDALYRDLCNDYDVTYYRLRQAFKAWEPSSAQAQSYQDIHFTIPKKGRPLKLPNHHEKVIVDGVEHFAANNTPLSKEGVKDLVQHYIGLLEEKEQEEIGFDNNKPSNRWVKRFSQRHGLSYRRVQQVEGVRVDAVKHDVVAEHIARMEAVYKRYNIKHARQLVNMDQSGSSFKKMVGRSLRKGMVPSDDSAKALALQKTLATRGSLDRVTVMPVVSADGHAYKPCVVYPGKHAHYRTVNGRKETLHDFLMKCYLYYNETSAANSSIILDWAHHFVDEVNQIRNDSEYMVLVLDGYGAHVQFEFLQYLRDNRIIVIALPSHTSHVLQPLDVSVFGPYKSYLQSELHRVSRIANKLNAFTVGTCILNAYSNAFKVPNIRSGFFKCGLWDMTTGSTNICALEHLFSSRSSNGAVSLTVVLQTFKGKERSLLRDVPVEDEGRIKIDTSRGANITSEKVLDVLKEREAKKAEQRKNMAEDDEQDVDVKEGIQAIRRYSELADRRHLQRKRLRESRGMRRLVRRARLNVGDN